AETVVGEREDRPTLIDLRQVARRRVVRVVLDVAVEVGVGELATRGLVVGAARGQRLRTRQGGRDDLVVAVVGVGRGPAHPVGHGDAAGEVVVGVARGRYGGRAGC